MATQRPRLGSHRTPPRASIRATVQSAIYRIRLLTPVRFLPPEEFLCEAGAQNPPRRRPRSPEGPAFGYQHDSPPGVRSKRTDGDEDLLGSSGRTWSSGTHARNFRSLWENCMARCQRYRIPNSISGRRNGGDGECNRTAFHMESGAH